MKVAFVIPWYGENIPGGAESECRRTAESLREAGIEVEVLTTCVREFASDWSANFHKAGVSQVNGVPVRRFKVRRRDARLFDAINAKLMRGLPVSPEEETSYIAETVNSDDLCEFISDHSQEYTFIFIPYMFGTTYWGSRICPERSHIIPCLHDESYAHMSIYRDMFQRVSGLLLHSTSELDLARRLYGIPDSRLHLVGEIVETDAQGIPEHFRSKYGIDGDFVLFAGRKDAGKNVPLLVDYFRRCVRHRGNGLKLVLIGSGKVDVAPGLEETIVDLPFVPQQDKYDAYSAALALCQPSLNESFSLVMMEAWVCGTPALVHEKCAVTREHCVASNGGLYFGNAAEFAECLDLLAGDRVLRDRLGQLGREYVLASYTRHAVVDRISRVILGSSDGDGASGTADRANPARPETPARTATMEDGTGHERAGTSARALGGTELFGAGEGSPQ